MFNREFSFIFFVYLIWEKEGFCSFISLLLATRSYDSSVQTFSSFELQDNGSRTEVCSHFPFSHTWLLLFAVVWPVTLSAWVCWDKGRTMFALSRSGLCLLPESVTRSALSNWSMKRCSIFNVYLTLSIPTRTLSWVSFFSLRIIKAHGHPSHRCCPPPLNRHLHRQVLFNGAERR